MAGFEVVVRPVVFPNIRPAPTRSLPPEDDPTKGFCVIKGSSGKVIDLPFSWSVSTSKTRPVETERRVDEVRSYQMEDDGTVNRKNFVDVEAANKITMREPGDPIPDLDPLPPLLPGTPQQRPSGFGEIKKPSFYSRVQESGNVEILRRDVIKTNPDVAGGGG
jgi:hypothetical protein